MKPKNILLFTLCIFINLLVGNIVLLMFPDLSIIYRILISLFILIIYGFAFNKLNTPNETYTKWQLVGISTILSLLGMLVACVFTSIGMRLPMDNIVTAGIKGVIPMFIFAIIFASPFWIPLALVNFICLNQIKKIEN